MSHRHGDQSRMAHPHMPWRSKSAEDKRSVVEDANGRGGSGASAAAQQEQQLWPTSRRQPKSPSPSATAAVREGSDLRPTGSPNIHRDRSSPESSARAGALGLVSPQSKATSNDDHNDHIPLAQSGGTLPRNSSEKSCPSPTERPMRPRPRERRQNVGDDQKTGPVDIVASKARARWPRSRPGYASSRGAGAVATSGRPIFPTLPEQGEITGSHMISDEGSRRVGVAGTAASNRGGGVLPSGTRRSDKGVMRSDRRKARGSVGATRITSGEVSYQIGQEIGRGGCGAVFQALNMATGDFVAIKRMEMDSVRLDAGASIKGEIDLLKKLNHPNIVKYIDTIQTEGHLHIVLELMESSLSAICKRFGNLSEPLTATYMTQVLEGLKYLHDQGVLHRDIKGANILTTKDGLVKLADFGVAMKLSDKQAFDVDVVGTPYWMAPEIIEMTGTTTACDVWSVGCTIIELLMGKPPYFDLPQMTALYKIVQDDHPPLPDGITQALRDFLLQCFKKQAQMRKSAVELLRHPWLKKPNNRRRKSIEVGNAELTPGGETSAAPPPPPDGRKGTIPAPPGVLAAVKRKVRAGKDDVEESDEDWDRDMGISKLTLADDGSSVGGVGYQGRGNLQPRNLTTIAPTSEEAKQKLRALQGAQERAADLPLIPKTLDANALDDWGVDEDETEDGFTTSAAASVSGFGVSPAVPIPSPRRGAAGGTVPLGIGGLEGTRSGSTASPFAGEGFGESFLQNSPLVEAVEAGGRGEGVIGMEATVLRRYMEKEEDEDDGLVFESIEVSGNQPLALGVKGQDDAGGDGQQGGSTLFAEDLKARMLSRQVEAQAAEEADDGFEDVFGHGFEDLIDGDDEGETGEKAERELHAKVGQDVYRELSRLEIRRSFTVSADLGSLRHPSKSLHGSTNHHNSLSELRGAGDSGDAGSTRSGGVTFGRAGRSQGPGAALPGVQEGGDAARGKTEDAPEEMDEEEMVVQTCVHVCSMLDACPQARHHVMSADRGVTPLMYLMQTVKPEGSRGEETMANVLAVINKIVDGNLKALETLAMIGLVPKVIAVLETRVAWEGELRNGRLSGVRGDSEAFSKVGGRGDPSGGLKMRVEAARLVRALCNGSDLTLQTFISCGGLAVLVQFLGEGPRMDGSGAAGADARRLVRIGIDGVLNVFSLQSHTAYASYLQRIRRNEFCKLFLRLGLVPRIMDTFTKFLGHAITAAAEPGRCLLEREASVAVLIAASGGGTGGTGAADPADLVWPYLSRATEILTTFSKGDSKIKEGMAEKQCLKGIMDALLKICPTYLNTPKFCNLAVSLLTVLKNVTMEPSTLDALDQAGAIATLVSLLGENKGYDRQARGVGAGGVGLGFKGHEGGACDGALENQILQCMFYLCRLSRKRQEKAAVAGLIPHLKRCVLKQSMLKQFALQMACDFAHASSVVRSLMWDEGLLDFYLSVMRSPQDRHWHVTIFGSLCAWLTSEGETDRVAGRLVEPLNLGRVISLFSTAQQFEFEDVVDKLHLMMDKSVALVKALGSSATFVCEVVKRLHYPKAVVGKTLLGMLRQIHQHHPDPQALVRDFDLYKVVLKLSQNDSQVLVAELADQLLQDLDTFQALLEGGGGDGGCTKGGAKAVEGVA